MADGQPDSSGGRVLPSSHFVLEQHAEWLDYLLKINVVWQTAHIVVRLLITADLPRCRLDDICADCSLRQEVHRAYLLRFLLEHFLMNSSTDDLIAFVLGLSRQRVSLCV